MALIVALVVAVVATPLAARLATRLGLVDHPGPLKVHARPVPYLGGLGVFVALAGPVLVTRPSMLVPLALAGALGVADDATSLPPAVRLVVELGIGIAAAWVMAPHDAGHVALGVAVVVVLVNAVNMLDGLDGLAAAVVAIGAAGFFVVLSGAGATLALALVGALLGFLVWNAPPARVYLGDAGSYLLGTALAMLFLAATHYDAAVISSACLFVGVPVADAAVAIVRRLRARTALLRGDRGHVYDQLVDRGWSARAATVACAATQAVLSAIGIAISVRSGTAAVVLTAAVVIGFGAAAFAAFTSPRAWSPDA
jgi:UDP-N-acetylmuramyl pentapeptide phosphotransferase/UDP-N-acetylglucosamine-1-phosphate transferase